MRIISDISTKAGEFFQEKQPTASGAFFRNLKVTNDYYSTQEEIKQASENILSNKEILAVAQSRLNEKQIAGLWIMAGRTSIENGLKAYSPELASAIEILGNNSKALEEESQIKNVLQIVKDLQKSLNHINIGEMTRRKTEGQSDADTLKASLFKDHHLALQSLPAQVELVNSKLSKISDSTSKVDIVIKESLNSTIELIKNFLAQPSDETKSAITENLIKSKKELESIKPNAQDAQVKIFTELTENYDVKSLMLPTRYVPGRELGRLDIRNRMHVPFHQADQEAKRQRAGALAAIVGTSALIGVPVLNPGLAPNLLCENEAPPIQRFADISKVPVPNWLKGVGKEDCQNYQSNLDAAKR
jgi:hypothetical protein